MAAARAAGADTYAPAELRAAEQALAGYEAAVQQRDYRQALRFAVEARNGAYEAAKRAADEKAAARSRAEQLLASFDDLVRAASTRPTASRAAAERLRAGVKSATATLQKARSLVEQQQYGQAIAVLTPAIEAFKAEPAASPGPAGRRAP